MVVITYISCFVVSCFIILLSRYLLYKRYKICVDGKLVKTDNGYYIEYYYRGNTYKVNKKLAFINHCGNLVKLYYNERNNKVICRRDLYYWFSIISTVTVFSSIAALSSKLLVISVVLGYINILFLIISVLIYQFGEMNRCKCKCECKCVNKEVLQEDGYIEYEHIYVEPVHGYEFNTGFTFTMMGEDTDMCYNEDNPNEFIFATSSIIYRDVFLFLVIYTVAYWLLCFIVGKAMGITL